MRGEHTHAHFPHDLMWGSSPRARGALKVGLRAWVCAGIIPACAGSTAARPLRVGVSGDHPRVRGEHSKNPSEGRRTGGSSPRARGAPCTFLYFGAMAGIIPACAGSTPCGSAPTRVSGDHPRVRGEHVETTTGMSPKMGSSPRARGARFPTCAFIARRRGFPPLSEDRTFWTIRRGGRSWGTVVLDGRR